VGQARAELCEKRHETQLTEGHSNVARSVLAQELRMYDADRAAEREEEAELAAEALRQRMAQEAQAAQQALQSELAALREQSELVRSGAVT
jgi:hypothetical protein